MYNELMQSTALFIKKNLTELLLLIVTLLAFLLRAWRINDIPFPPNDSELFFGYYGWSLLNFQIDEFGNRWPINFPSIGDFKYPGLAYLNIIPALIWGLEVITVRFWSVFTGVLLVPFLYLFTLLLTKSKKIAIAGSFILSVSPWSIVLSRIGYENHVALSFLMIGIVLVLLPFANFKNLGTLYLKIESWAVKRKMLLTIVGFVMIIISTFTYAATRLFAPLFLLSLVIFGRNTPLKQSKKTLFAIFALVTIIVTISLIPWQNRGRTDSIIYKEMTPFEANRQQELIQESGLSPVRTPVLLTRILVSKYRIMASHLFDKYINHFSPDFLFVKGDPSYEKIPDTGMLLLIEVLLLPLGVLYLFNKNRKALYIVLIWLLLAPVASTLTTGSAINRASLMIPALAILSGAGVINILSIKNKLGVVIKGSLFFAIFFSTLFSLYQIFVIKPIHQAWYPEIVNRELMKEIAAVKDQYDAVVISKEEYIYYLYYTGVSPVEFLSDADINPLDRNNPWDRVNRYSNIYFKMDRDCPSSGKLNVLYLCKGENIPQNSNILKVYRYRDGVPAYTLITFIPISNITQPLPPIPSGLKYMVDLESNPSRQNGIIPESSELMW